MRLFENDDYPIIFEWFEKRGMRTPPFNEFPRSGFIVDMHAAGFLIETDTSMAMFDFFISNPESPRALRDKALDQIVKGLSDLAKRRKYKYILCSSQVAAIERRAIKNHFRPLGLFKMFQKEL
jgi:hypothetical protein